MVVFCRTVHRQQVFIGVLEVFDDLADFFEVGTGAEGLVGGIAIEDRVAWVGYLVKKVLGKKFVRRASPGQARKRVTFIVKKSSYHQKFKNL